jgi:hypothetical protein
MCNPDPENGDQFVLLSDLTVPPVGAVHADDFIPETDLIDTICVWGTYLDASNQGADNFSCSGEVEDNVRVRIYDDAKGLPGDLVAERWVTDPVKLSVPDCPGWNYTYEDNDPLEVFTLSFPAIWLDAGVTFWLEVANKTDYLAGAPVPERNTCYWHWMQVVRAPTEGNRVNATGTDDRCAGGYYRGYACEIGCQDCCPGGVCKAGYGGGYIDGSERWSGTMFCLGYEGAAVNFTPGGVVTGACCDCDDICVEGMTQADCADLTTGFDRRWRQGESCVSTTACDPEPGDNCASPAGTVAVAGYASAAPQEASCVPIKDGLYAIDTACTNTDGFCCPTGQPDNQLGKDVWYCYTTTNTGEFIASMCPSSIYWGGYDSYMAIHHDYNNPTECPCPGDSLAFQRGESDEDCNGIWDGGAGTFGPQIVLPGECWLIRVGGWAQTAEETESGPGFLDVATTCHHCDFRSDPPEPERLDKTPDNPVNVKNRFLSIVGTNPGRTTAIRVKAVSLPPPFDVWIGREWYVGEPFPVCENAGQGLDVRPDVHGCGPAPGVYASGQDWLWAAPLVCHPINAHYMDWTTLADYCNTPGAPAYDAHRCVTNADCGTGTCGVDGVIHLYHEGIVASHMATTTGPIDDPAVYNIQVIDSIFPLTGCEHCYSWPLTLTQAGWGDVVEDTSQCPNGPPDERVDVVTDVVAMLNKFRNDPCAVQKSRADLVLPNLDFKIDITDVVQCKDAFEGAHYPFGAGNCYCVDPSCTIKQCSGGPDHGVLCETDDDCSSDPCGLDP